MDQAELELRRRLWWLATSAEPDGELRADACRDMWQGEGLLATALAGELCLDLARGLLSQFAAEHGGMKPNVRITVEEDALASIGDPSMLQPVLARAMDIVSGTSTASHMGVDDPFIAEQVKILHEDGPGFGLYAFNLISRAYTPDLSHDTWETVGRAFCGHG